MQKTIVLVSILFIITLSGCIEISETIKINKDKSGSISYELKSSSTAGLLSMFSGFFEVTIEDQVMAEANKFIKQLKKQKGISNIQQDFNSQNGFYSVSFDFENSKYFNEALYSMAGSKKNIFTPGYLKIKNSRFKKLNFSPWIKRYLDKEEIELPASPLTELITFTSSVEFPYNVVKAKPVEAMISANPKKVQQEFKLVEVTSGKANTGLRVKYKK